MKRWFLFIDGDIDRRLISRGGVAMTTAPITSAARDAAAAYPLSTSMFASSQFHARTELWQP